MFKGNKENLQLKYKIKARLQWLTHVTLATQEAEIRRTQTMGK
jgi:hypothetical protein